MLGKSGEREKKHIKKIKEDKKWLKGIGLWIFHCLCKRFFFFSSWKTSSPASLSTQTLGGHKNFSFKYLISKVFFLSRRRKTIDFLCMKACFFCGGLKLLRWQKDWRRGKKSIIQLSNRACSWPFLPFDIDKKEACNFPSETSPFNIFGETLKRKNLIMSCSMVWAAGVEKSAIFIRPPTLNVIRPRDSLSKCFSFSVVCLKKGFAFLLSVDQDERNCWNCSRLSNFTLD